MVASAFSWYAVSMQNYTKKFLPTILIIIIVGVAGYLIGKWHTTNQLLSDQSASVQIGIGTDQNDWWPAGGGMCWHKVKPWSYVVLGQISGLKCLALTGPISDKFENLTKTGTVQLVNQNALPTTNTSK